MIKQRNPDGINLPYDLRTDDFAQFNNQLVVPHRLAPVLFKPLASLELVQMKFSLLPSWSKDSKVKFATHNARLESIDEKPTWRSVFVKRHCLVPLTDFIEPIYEGEQAGNMVAFHAVTDPLLWAAGVWDKWVSPLTGEVIQSFAIITTDPLKYVRDVGHDRSPVFLKTKAGQDWLSSEGGKPKELKAFLFDSAYEPELSVEVFRTMKPGWEKRK